MTGRELWRTPREEKTTWATPLVVLQGKPQVVAAASDRVRAYDLQDGKLLWDAPGFTPNTIPTPVYGDGLLQLRSGFRGPNPPRVSSPRASRDGLPKDAAPPPGSACLAALRRGSPRPRPRR